MAAKVLQRCMDYFKLTGDDLQRLPKSDARKMLMAGLLRYHYPVRVAWVSDMLVMGHCTTVSRAMRFYDDVQGVLKRKKQAILKFTG